MNACKYYILQKLMLAKIKSQTRIASNTVSCKISKYKKSEIKTVNGFKQVEITTVLLFIIYHFSLLWS